MHLLLFLPRFTVESCPQFLTCPLNFKQISRELDALSHFHFTPRPVVADSKIRTLQPSTSALSSLQLEDITPLTSAQASTSQLAPEQVRDLVVKMHLKVDT